MVVQPMRTSCSKINRLYCNLDVILHSASFLTMGHLPFSLVPHDPSSLDDAFLKSYDPSFCALVQISHLNAR